MRPCGLNLWPLLLHRIAAVPFIRMKTPSESIAAYLHAKDGNRPHLLAQAFTDDAMLQMAVHTGAISFPPVSRGRETIGEVLVRRFGQSYENVYTFCPASPPEAGAQVFAVTGWWP